MFQNSKFFRQNRPLRGKTFRLGLPSSARDIGRGDRILFCPVPVCDLVWSFWLRRSSDRFWGEDRCRCWQILNRCKKYFLLIPWKKTLDAQPQKKSNHVWRIAMSREKLFPDVLSRSVFSYWLIGLTPRVFVSTRRTLTWVCPSGLGCAGMWYTVLYKFVMFPVLYFL